MSSLSNLFLRPSKSSKLGHFQGTQTLLRETNPKGWGGQSAPLRTAFFLLKCQDRLRMSGKKWRLAILVFQLNSPITSILSILGYQCCADFTLHRGFRLLRQPDFCSAGSAIPSISSSARTFRIPDLWSAGSAIQSALSAHGDHRFECTNRDFD